MSDYNLDLQNRRPAQIGDRLVFTRFGGATSPVFYDADHRDIAVCLAPGTELVFERPVTLSRLFRYLLPSHLPAFRTARFRQINGDNHLVYHDALEFENGQTVLLAHIEEGQQATVLQLPVSTDLVMQNKDRAAISVRNFSMV